MPSESVRPPPSWLRAPAIKTFPRACRKTARPFSWTPSSIHPARLRLGDAPRSAASVTQAQVHATGRRPAQGLARSTRELNELKHDVLDEIPDELFRGRLAEAQTCRTCDSFNNSKSSLFAIDRMSAFEKLFGSWTLKSGRCLVMTSSQMWSDVVTIPEGCAAMFRRTVNRITYATNAVACGERLARSTEAQSRR